jgi:osmotically-inducible protein OsmY
MRFRTVVLAGTAGAAVTYLFDPRKGGLRRSRLRSSVASLANLGLERPTDPLPPNLAPMRSEPIHDDAEPRTEVTDDAGTKSSESGIDVTAVETPGDVTVIEMPRDAAEPSIRTPVEEKVVDLVSIERNGADGESHDDGTIVQRVRSRLDERRDLRTDDLTVDVVNGVAYLCGELHDPHTFGEVVEVTRATPGVRRVQSLLHLPESEVLARIAGRSSADEPRD